MLLEKTLSIIKPDAVKAGHIGKIVSRFDSEGFTVKTLEMTQMDEPLMEEFYEEHKDKTFFEGLVKFMCSGEVVLLVLEGENVVAKNREIMGATDPMQASGGTLRQLFGTEIPANAVHGSDSLESAKREITLMFGRRAWER